MADFSEDENEEVLNTDALLENLEKDITEALDEVPVLGEHLYFHAFIFLSCIFIYL